MKSIQFTLVSLFFSLTSRYLVFLLVKRKVIVNRHLRRCICFSTIILCTYFTKKVHTPRPPMSGLRVKTLEHLIEPQPPVLFPCPIKYHPNEQ